MALDLNLGSFLVTRQILISDLASLEAGRAQSLSHKHVLSEVHEREFCWVLIVIPKPWGFATTVIRHPD